VTLARFDCTSAPGSNAQRAALTHKGNVRVRRRRHGWLRLTPAYSLHLVEDLLADAGEGDLVLDPFSGTGTTAVASATLGVPAHSVDINPFLVWLGNLKCTRFSRDQVSAFRDEANRIARSTSGRSRSGSLWTPDIHRIDRWWNGPTLTSLSALFGEIAESSGRSSGRLVDLLKVAFCRTAIETSNASFGHPSMSFKKPSSARDEALPDERPSGDERAYVIGRFRESADFVALGMAEDDPIADSRVFLGDSRDLATALPSRRYTRVITSPPYPNRMSYIRELRPYMYWLGYLANGREAGELDWRAIGGTWGCATSNLGSWRPRADRRIPYPGFQKIVAAISERHGLLGPYVRRYFEDAQQHVASLGSVLERGARCHYVVGNSKFYDTLLPSEEIYAALFEDAKFSDVSIERIRKRNSKKELYEFAVHATFPGRRRLGPT
jgi:hypothetical protein